RSCLKDSLRAGPKGLADRGGRSGGQIGVAETAKLLQGLTLELADSLGGDAVLGTDVRELVLPAVGESVAGANDFGRSVVELGDERVEALARLHVEHGPVGARDGLLAHEIAQGGVAVLVQRGVERDVVASP